VIENVPYEKEEVVSYVYGGGWNDLNSRTTHPKHRATTWKSNALWRWPCLSVWP
jgi:hypothetical protein